MDTNASYFENGIYIWKLRDGEATGIYAIKKESYAGLIIAIIGTIIFATGIYIILRNPFNNNIQRRKNKQNNSYDYDDYGYQDNYY